MSSTPIRSSAPSAAARTAGSGSPTRREAVSTSPVMAGDDRVADRGARDDGANHGRLVISRSALRHVDLPIHATADHAPDLERRRRWPVVLVAVLVLIAAFVISTSLITAPYTVLIPGDALPVSELITVPPARAHRCTARFCSPTSVSRPCIISSTTTNGSSRTATTPSSPPASVTYNLPESQFDAQGIVDMAESQLTAKSVALRQLGYSVPEHDAGVTIYVIDPGSPGIGGAAGRRGHHVHRQHPDHQPRRTAERGPCPSTRRHRHDPGRLHHPSHARPCRQRPPRLTDVGPQEDRVPRHRRPRRPPGGHGDAAGLRLPLPGEPSTVTTSGAPRPAWRGPSGS